MSGQMGDIITIGGKRWVVSERHEHWQYYPAVGRRCLNPDSPEEDQVWDEGHGEQVEYKTSVYLRCLDVPGAKFETMKKQEVYTRDTQGRWVLCCPEPSNGEVLGPIQEPSGGQEEARSVEEVQEG